MREEAKHRKRLLYLYIKEQSIDFNFTFVDAATTVATASVACFAYFFICTMKDNIHTHLRLRYIYMCL